MSNRMMKLNRKQFMFGLAGLALPIALASRSAAGPGGLTVTYINHKPYSLDDGKHLATVIIFIAHDCPIANAYAPEIKRICKQYRDKSVQFILVYSEADLTSDQARKHAKDYGYMCPIVLDNDHALARKIGAKITPEAFVIDSKGKQAYHGRIDDLYPEVGVRRYEVTKHDLRLALDALLAGKKISPAATKAVGCFIPTN